MARGAEDEGRYRLIVQSAIDFGIVAIDVDGRISEWSRGAEQILGWPSGDMIGQPIDTIFTPEDRVARVPEREMRGALDKGCDRAERWHLKKDGQAFWAASETFPLVHEERGHVGFVKILRDRTEQHRAGEAVQRAVHDALHDPGNAANAASAAHATNDNDQAALLELAERQATQLAELNGSLERQVRERTEDRNALWQLSRDIMLRAQPGGVITAVNPAWTDVLGWTEEELVGRNLYEVIHPEDATCTIKAAQDVIEAGCPARLVNRCRRRDGTYRWISWTSRFADGLVNAVGRDVTEEREAAEALKRSEDTLRQVQKMEAVGQLTGGLAHDFNNLLAAIAGALELMTMRLAQGRHEDLARYISTARGAAKRAAALTHRLLAFSRRQTLDPKPTDVNKLVENMEELVRRTIGPSIRLRLKTADRLWTTLIDPPQLESALLNLCINARDAMPEGGSITIETSNQWVDEANGAHRDMPAGAYVAIRVADTGAGMSPDTVSRAFDPFFTTKPLGQGTGLGLSMVYGFVRQSGGQVRIESEIGRGTSICVYLPQHAGHVPDDEDAEVTSPMPLANQEAVLVVDDEPMVRMLVRDVLEDLGYRVMEAEDGLAGLRLLESGGSFDLVISDIGLPGGMSGRQMVEAARLLQPRLRVLFITGFAENAVLGHEPLVHGMALMTKPFAIEALVTRVRELLA